MSKKQLVRNRVYKALSTTIIGGCTFEENKRYIYWHEDFILYDGCKIVAFVIPPDSKDFPWTKKGSFMLPPQNNQLICKFYEKTCDFEKVIPNWFDFFKEVDPQPYEIIKLPPRTPSN
jgi:hypothetical protein